MSYLVFKHKVRMKMPKFIRFKTVCRKCIKTTRTTEKCLTCKIDGASGWTRPY
jgi:hypothetical protein